MMKKIKTTYLFLKKNIGTIVTVGIAGYIVYMIYKVFSDKGLDKSGKPYYEDFGDDPSNTDSSEKDDDDVIEDADIIKDWK